MRNCTGKRPSDFLLSLLRLSTQTHGILALYSIIIYVWQDLSLYLVLNTPRSKQNKEILTVFFINSEKKSLVDLRL